MPTSPKFGRACGDKRVVEVLGKVKAEHPPESYRHIAVTRKIKVYLQRKEQSTRPYGGERRSAGQRVERSYRSGAVVGDQHFSAETARKAAYTAKHIVRIRLYLVESGRNISVADDRPCDELRKKGYVEQQPRKRALRRIHSAIDVDYIRQRLKYEKADAYRQTYAGQRQRASEYGIDGAYDKIGILENAEQGDIYQHSEHTQHPADAVALSSLLAYQSAEQPVGKDGAYHQQNVYRLAPCVEEQ